MRRDIARNIEIGHHMFQNPTQIRHDRRRHHRDPRRGPDGAPFGFRGAFGGGRGRGSMVRRGEIRPLILAALTTKPMHGYEVITELEAQSGGRWRPSAGSVYPTLQQLADEGLVTSEEIDGRRVYALTDEGKAAAAAGPQSPWSDAGRGQGNDVRQLARQVAEAAMQVQRVGTPEAAIAAQQILIDTRARLYGLLASDAGSGAFAPTDDDGADQA
jgi:DNA-binding PadR family transcriptional regulator